MTKKKQQEKNKDTTEFNIQKAIKSLQINKYMEPVFQHYIKQENIKIESKKDLKEAFEHFQNL